MLWRTARTTWLALLLVASACSSSTGPVGPATASSSLHGEVTDPVGDALADPRVPTSPDLVHATADVTAGSLTFVIIQFAPGTLDRQTTRVSLLLDTDQDGSTGISQADGIGADYSVDLAAGTSQAAVNKADPVSCAARLSCFTSVGTVPLTFVTDGMQ